MFVYDALSVWDRQRRIINNKTTDSKFIALGKSESTSLYSQLLGNAILYVYFGI